MSRFSGRYVRGAARDDRRRRRLDAVAAWDDQPEPEPGDDATDRRRPNPAPPEKDCE